MKNQINLFNAELYYSEPLNHFYEPAWSVPEQPKEVCDTVLEQNESCDSETAPEQSISCNHWIEEYSPSNRKSSKYFRYCWMERRKINHIHIKGGNVNSPLVICRKLDIELEIKMGTGIEVILEMIRSY